MDNTKREQMRLEARVMLCAAHTFNAIADESDPAKPLDYFQQAGHSDSYHAARKLGTAARELRWFYIGQDSKRIEHTA